MALSADEKLAAIQAILDEAGDAPLSDTQVAEIDRLESEIRGINKTIEIRARAAAYQTVTSPVITAGAPVPDAQVRAFETYLRGGTPDPKLLTRAQSEGVGSQGGYLVPAGTRDKLVECLYSFGGLSAVVEEYTSATGETVTWPTISDGTSDAAIAARAGITPENSEFTFGGDLVFGEAALSAYKYTTTGPNSDPLRVSVELLQDAKYNVEDIIAKHFANRIGRAQARHWATGNGVGQPQGILTQTAEVELVTANTFANAANGYAKLLEIEAALDSAYLPNARWVFNRVVWNQIRAIVDADGRPLIQANNEAGIGGKVGNYTLLGYPVTIDESFPDPAQNVNFMVFGDVRSGYVIRRVGAIHVVVNPWTRAEFGQVEFTAWERADGLIQDACAFVTVKGID